MDASALLKNTITITGTVNANTKIIAGAAGKRIKLTGYALTTTYSVGSLGIIFTDGNAGATLWAMTLQALAGSISGANLAKSEPAFICACSLGNDLYFNPAGQNVTYSVSYQIDDSF